MGNTMIYINLLLALFTSLMIIYHFKISLSMKNNIFLNSIEFKKNASLYKYIASDTFRIVASIFLVLSIYNLSDENSSRFRLTTLGAILTITIVLSIITAVNIIIKHVNSK